MSLSKKEIFIFALVALIFVCLHIPGLHIPYHQDEYKWPQYANPAIFAPGSVPHPPLTEFLYRIIGGHLGYDNFRFIPFFFGIFDLFLIFYLAYIIFDKKTALWVAGLFAVSYYSLLASLMVDVDGAVMPFFLLIMAIGYYKWKAKDYPIATSAWLPITLILVGGIGGFLVKVITALPILAIAGDYALEKDMFSDKKKIFRLFFYTIIGVIGLVVILVLSKFVFPFFHLEYAFKYWEHFINFGNRGWFQTFIQIAKSVLYCSPLLVLPVIFGDKEIFKKTRPFILFIIFELFTYVIAFDFSTGALDRYFQFLIVPLCLIVGAIYAQSFSVDKTTFHKKSTTILFVAAAGIFFLQFLPQSVPALYPKSAWISRILSLKWNFLYVFSGGSGPFPFYVSFGFIALCWILSAVLVMYALRKKNFKSVALCGILIIGLMYNIVFTEEYLFGKINGSGTQLLSGAIQFIKNDSDITKVVVYNDNGGYNIQELGKYEKRLYTSPDFNLQDKITSLNTYKDYYLEVNIPRIDPTSVYRKYLDSCKTVYSQTDKYISAIVHDCRNAPTITE